MLDLAYAFTIFFVTLGPLKTIPAFYLVTDGIERDIVVSLATRSATLSTIVVLFVALVATGTMVQWRVSTDAMAIAGGLLLLISSITVLTSFQARGAPAPASSQPATQLNIDWLGQPVLSPLTVPVIITPIGVVAVLYFAGLAVGNVILQAELEAVLVSMMALNFLAMLQARPIMRAIGQPVLQLARWVISAIQAGLGVEFVIGAVRRLTVDA